ncbi:tRNA pseudouridine(55) synthase TruB [Corynebacterium sp. zg-331]|uniref:tRNA pseudouridine(55) synthase TruB n=1 Tax=unclassified Corynebacterium TaxID=2624378 RepID=UPI00128C4054|nr:MULTISPECIES: tRNA pseudouridine(55) synthase TruB [unclassified Corynebacterium]MBC3185362.1 tRNA pseudouridine(55) synthase TruB [Corynebacterium sp. zg-331]MPV51859.1 tRNA pseudouridine(55) synthase TruB [Corynebacterium sp. zg331]
MMDPLARSGIVVVDKPQGLSSHDVVVRLRKAMGTKKVGHAGTLDPMATGVLVTGIGRGTKFLAHLTAATKAYRATIRLGQATTTDDAEGEITAQANTEALRALDTPRIEHAIAALTGDIMQRPSSFSAIKIDGQRAYARARAGEKVEIAPRPVTVSRFTLLDRRDTDLDVEVRCSSGTYIRALARDLGATLGVGGHLTALRRTEVGPLSLADAAPLDELAENPRLSLTLDQALPRCYPTVAVTHAEAEALAKGQWLEPRGLSGVHAAVDPEGRSIALIREKGSRLATVFVARPSTL